MKPEDLAAFLKWWKEESGWGGASHLSIEGQLALKAWKAALK